MTITLSGRQLFEVKEELKVGTMRVDFDNRYNNGPLCNKWFPATNAKTLVDEGRVDLSEIQKVVNAVQFEMFKSFDHIVKHCNGMGYSNEKHQYFEYGSCNYALKFIPVVGDYNLYIFVYSK